MRRLVKHLGAHGLRATGAHRLIGALNGSSRQPLVVCYHRVVEDVRRHPWSAPAMLISLPTLEAQLDWIGRRYRFVGLDELAAYLADPGRAPGGNGPGRGGPGRSRPLAAVTFDDGYADVYRNALPLLRRKGIPAAFFVVTGTAGTDRLLPHDELYALLRRVAEERGAAGLAATLERGGVGDGFPARAVASPVEQTALVELSERLLGSLELRAVRRLIHSLCREAALPEELRDELRAMSWPMIAELDRAGMTVGCHTHSHRILALEPRRKVVEVLARSKAVLEERLGHEVAHLAYPNGQFSAASVEAAAAAGFRYAYSICAHRYDPRPLLAIPRRVFWEGTMAGLRGGFSPAVAACQVRGVFDAARPCRFDHGGEHSGSVRDDAGSRPEGVAGKAAREIGRHAGPAAGREAVAP